MKKSIALLLISLLFLASCAKEQETAGEIDERVHYLKAKKYYRLYRLRGVVDLDQTDKELEWKLDKYRKTLGELDLAVFETTGDAREEVMEMLEECNDNIDLIRDELDKRARNIREYRPRSFKRRRHNQAIADSRAEIQRKRSAVGAE